jgi:hypothetical protein
MSNIQNRVREIPEDWGNNPTVHSMRELLRALRERVWERGYIKLEGDSFEINGAPDFPPLQSENKERPVVLKAKSIGGATFKGRGVLVFKKPKNLVLYGINFSYATGEENAMNFQDAMNCKILRCDFRINSSQNRYAYLRFRDGDSNRIAYNDFHDKKRSSGQFLLITGEETGCTNTLIEYNHFRNLPGIGSEPDGGEALFVGGSEQKRIPYETIVRYNLFENCNGDKECITNKSSHNTYHHNTFRGNKGSLSLRHGSDNIVDSNVFLGARDGDKDERETTNNGIRVYGNRQRITNNYFKCERLSGSELLRPLVIGNGNWPRDPTREEVRRNLCLDQNSPENPNNHSAYAQVKDSHFERNVILVGEGNNRNKRIVIWGYENGNEKCPRDYKPKSTEFKNNIIVAKSGTMFEMINGATRDDNMFRDNKLFNDGGSAEKGNMPGEGISSDRPTEQELRPPKALKREDVGPFSTLFSSTPYRRGEEEDRLLREEVVSDIKR